MTSLVMRKNSFPKTHSSNHLQRGTSISADNLRRMLIPKVPMRKSREKGNKETRKFIATFFATFCNLTTWKTMALLWTILRKILNVQFVLSLWLFQGKFLHAAMVIFCALTVSRIQKLNHVLFAETITIQENLRDLSKLKRELKNWRLEMILPKIFQFKRLKFLYLK